MVTRAFLLFPLLLAYALASIDADTTNGPTASRPAGEDSKPKGGPEAHRPERKLLLSRRKNRKLLQKDPSFLTCKKFRWMPEVPKSFLSGNVYDNTATKRNKEGDSYMTDCQAKCEAQQPTGECRAMQRTKVEKDSKGRKNDYCRLFNKVDFQSGQPLSSAKNDDDFILRVCDDCNPNPCQNLGTCDYGAYFNSYKCSCPEGSEGADCGTCSAGFKQGTNSCVDVCDADAKTQCSDANKEACSPRTTACGGCKQGFKPDGDSCVDVCDAGAKQQCSDANEEACSPGTTDCGGCKQGFKLEGNICVDVCDAGAMQQCSDANKEACSPGTTDCGGCKQGFKQDGDSCIDVCDVGLKLDASGVCVDVCDSGAKEVCSSANKLSCLPGSETCGDCMSGFSPVDGDSCRGTHWSHEIVLQGISASTFNSNEKIILSFSETVSELLGVSLSAVVNVKAESPTTRRRRFLNTPGKTTERKLTESSCTVTYDIYPESDSERERMVSAFASNVACGESCSVAFSAAFQAKMQSSEVDDDVIAKIQADSSAPMHEGAGDKPDDPTHDQADSEGTTSPGQLVPGFDDWMVFGAGGLVAILVLIAIVMVVRSCRRAKNTKRMKLDEGVGGRQTFSKQDAAVAIVEMNANPMKRKN